MALTKAKLIADGVIVAANLHPSHGITSANIGENTNLYFTNARARSAISVSGNALSYNSSTGVITSNFEESPTFTGNVAISGNLTMNNAGNIQIGGYNSGNDRGIIFTPADSSGYWHIYNDAGGSLAFGANSTIGSSEKMRITGSGNVGIGNTSPDAFLHIGGAPAISAEALIVRGNANGQYAVSIEQDNSSGFGMIIDTDSTDSSDPAFKVQNPNGSLFDVRSNGNIGIGTTSPSANLEVAGDVLVASGEFISWGGVGETSIEGSNVSNKLQFRTSSANRMIINNTGVGIGTTSPGQKLEVAGRIRVTTDPTIEFYEASNKRGGVQWDATNDYVNMFAVGGDIRFDIGGEKMRILSGGNIGIGTTSPNAKLEVVGKTYFNDTSNPDGGSGVGEGGSLIVEGRRDGTANLIALRARDASAPTVALPNGQGGLIRWQGFDGSDFAQMGAIAVVADGQAVANNDAPSKMIFYTTADGGEALTTALTLDKSQNATFASDISIPVAKKLYFGGGSHTYIGEDIDDRLRFFTGGTEFMRFTEDTSDTINFYTDATFAGAAIVQGDDKSFIVKSANGTINATMGAASSSAVTTGAITVRHGGTTKIVLNANDNSYFNNGNVGIGTTSPNDKLHIVGNLFIENSSPEITFETGSSHYNWQIAAQENVNAALEFSVGSQDADASNDTFTPKMVILQNGNVGIGTTSPALPLQINHGSSSVALYTYGGFNHQAKFESADAEAAIIIQDSNSTNNGNRIGVITNDMTFITNDVEKMRIKSNGKVGIGTLNAQNAELAIKSGSNVDLELFSESSGTAWQSYNRTTSAWGYLRFLAGGGEQMRVHTNGYVGIGTTSPAQKLEVVNSGFAYVRTRSTAGSFTGFDIGQHTGGGIFLNNRDNTAITLMTNNTTAITIDNSQNTSFAGSISVAVAKANTLNNQANSHNIIYRTGTSTLVGGGSTANKLYVLDNGKVGLGTTTPNHKVDIYSNENVPLRIHRPSNSNLDISGAWGIGFSTRGDTVNSTTDTRAGIFSYYNGNLFFATNTSSVVADPDASARMLITSAGYVGIGTTSPSAQLDVSGSSALFMTRASAGLATYIENDGGYAALYMYQLGGGQKVKIHTNSTSFFNGGNVGIGTTSPDNLLTLDAAAGSMHQRFKEAGTTIGFIGGANGIISSQNGKLAVRAESGLVLSSQGNATDVLIDSGSAYFNNGTITCNNVGGDKKIAFRRTGANNFSIEHDSSQIYFYNESTTESPILMRNDGEVRMNAGNVGINDTNPNTRLRVRGAIGVGAAIYDSNIAYSVTGFGAQDGGALHINFGLSAVTSSGDTITFTYGATSWKSWSLNYNFASTNGISKGVVGGYWNNSGGSSHHNETDNLGISVAVTHGGTNNQSNIVTFTFTALGTHPMAHFVYMQSGGDGQPRADRVTLNAAT